MSERKTKNASEVDVAKISIAGTKTLEKAETPKAVKGEKKEKKSAKNNTETESAKTKAVGVRETKKKKEASVSADLGDLSACGEDCLVEKKNKENGATGREKGRKRSESSGCDWKDTVINTDGGECVESIGTKGMEKSAEAAEKGDVGVMKFCNSDVSEGGGVSLGEEIVGEGGSVMETQKNMRVESGSFVAVEKSIGGSEIADSLAGYMTRLLQMPVDEEKREVLLASGYCGGEVNQAMLLAQSVLDKAIEKGDIAAFKAVKAMMEEEGSESSQLERIVCAIASNVRKTKEGSKTIGEGMSEARGQVPE